MKRRKRIDGSLKDRLLARLPVTHPDECWEWQGQRDSSGYGRMSVRVLGSDPPRHRPHMVHRVAWEIFNGRMIPDGLIVCHHCDNPPCANPFHLYAGTYTQNVHDMDRRGRRVDAQPRGEANGNSSLTENDVLEIRRRYLAGEPQRGIARSFATTQANVQFVVSGRTWPHVGGMGSVDELKRRKAVGHGRPTAKLNPDAVREIRRRHEAGETQVQISKDYGVSSVAIHNVVARKTWAHVA